MPIFDYLCPMCGREAEYLVRHWDDTLNCGNGCEGVMDKLSAVPNMHLFPEGGIHLKHVIAGGKTFHSKNEMKKYAKEHNLELGALL